MLHYVWDSGCVYRSSEGSDGRCQYWSSLSRVGQKATHVTKHKTEGASILKTFFDVDKFNGSVGYGGTCDMAWIFPYLSEIESFPPTDSLGLVFGISDSDSCSSTALSDCSVGDMATMLDIICFWEENVE